MNWVLSKEMGFRTWGLYVMLKVTQWHERKTEVVRTDYWTYEEVYTFLEILKGPENILGVLEQVEAVKIVQLHNGLWYVV